MNIPFDKKQININISNITINNLNIYLNIFSSPIVKLTDLYGIKYPDLEEAILAIINAVKNDITRGQVRMPTATGKTLVITEATRILTDHLDKSSFVITGSTIALAMQHYETFETTIKENTNSRFGKTKILLVCSDKDKKRNLTDENVLVNITTDPNEVVSFVKEQKENDNPYIIVSTYHSLESVVGKAYSIMSDASEQKQSMDVTFYDEAHNATNNQFLPTVNDENYSSKFRFFLTATPRETKRKDLEKNQIVGTRDIGMDNYEVFGNVLYHMTPKEAIERNLIIPPIVLMTSMKGSYEKHIMKFMEGNIDKLKEQELRTEAALVYGGLSELYNQSNKVKAIVYCRSVDHAKNLDNNVNWSSALGIPGLKTFFVAATIRGEERDKALKGFGEADNAIVFNYRVLSEGINIEDTNGVVMLRAFEDAVTLAQAIGRTLRLDPRDRSLLAQGLISRRDLSQWYKPYGYVILPETMGREQNKEFVLGRSIEYVKTLYNLGFEDSKIMGFNLADEYGEDTKKRVKKYLKDKYDIDYYEDNVKSLAEIFKKYGFVSIIEIIEEMDKEKKENIKENLREKLFL